jgi:hypothetical protein
MDEYKEYQNIMANVKEIDSLGNSFTESTSTLLFILKNFVENINSLIFNLISIGVILDPLPLFRHQVASHPHLQKQTLQGLLQGIMQME